MKILFLSYYYAPDLSAGSFRASRLVRALLKEIPPSAQIDVISTLPNRYHSFSVAAKAEETTPQLSVTRLPVTSHKSGVLDQAKAYCRYAQQVMQQIKGKDYDLVVGTSSRLMTAVLSAYVARRKKAGLYLDIRDIFVDTIKHIVPGWAKLPIKLIFKPLEIFALRNADKVNLISPGFKKYFEDRFPSREYSYYSNCVDAEFVNLPFENQPEDTDRRLRVVYAGNIGEGQGLHKVLIELAERLKDKIRFRIIGDGGRRDLLLEKIQQSNLDNIELVSPIDRLELRAEYHHADILFVHLNDFSAFEKVLPSKIFEYAATGKPIWAGVAGFAATFLEKEVENAAIFTPCDARAAVVAFDDLNLDVATRDEFVDKFSCELILTGMAKDVLSTVQPQH